MLLSIVFACSKVAMLFSHVFFQKITSSAFMFMSMIHFKLIFLNGMKQGSKVIFFPYVYPMFQHHLWERSSLLHSIALVPLSKINRPATCESIVYFLCSFNLCVYFYAKPRCLDYCKFRANFKVRQDESSNFVLLYHDCFVYMGPLYSIYILESAYQFVLKVKIFYWYCVKSIFCSFEYIVL